MKKWAKTLISVLLVFIFVFSLCSCGNADKKENDFVLSKGAERKIKKAYLPVYFERFGEDKKKTIDDVDIRYYLGNYNGSLVVVIYGNTWNDIGEMGIVELDGIKFVFKERLSVYSSGRLYELWEAYELGILMKTDLEQLSERYYNIPGMRPD